MRDNKTNPTASQGRGAGRSLWKLVVAGIAVFTAAAITLTIVFSSLGYRGTVRKITGAYRAGSVERLYDLTWFPYENEEDEAEKAEDDAKAKAFLTGRINSMNALLDDAFGGKKCRLGFRITKVTPMQKSWIKEANEILEANGATGKIDDAKLVEVTFTAKRGGKTVELAPDVFRLVKVDGRWYLTYEGEFDELDA